jgi:hypothetical protein
MADTKRTKAELKALATAGVRDSWSYQDHRDLIESALAETGTVDPSAGAGVAAPIGMIYVRTSDETAWIKTGLADTAWRQLAVV